MATRSNIAIQFLRNTSSSWSNISRPLSIGELAIETDTGYVKVGDGVNAFSNTTYAGFTSTDGATGFVRPV